MSDLVVGVRIRADADRATGDAIRRFYVAGTVVATDSSHIIFRTGDPQATDTLDLSALGASKCSRICDRAVIWSQRARCTADS
jgi:hypothetical protein